MAKPKLSSRQPHQVLDLERYVPALLVFLANKLTSSASAIFRRQFGVGVTEWRVLAMVAVEPEITAGRICRVIGFDKAAVSRALAVLLKKALVQARSHESDGRSSAYALTARGWLLHDRILKISLEREQRLLGDLSAAERETLIGLLNRLHSHLPDLNGAIDAGDRRGRSSTAGDR
jgi:DNA-binding MarR family transcriptional regulator